MLMKELHRRYHKEQPRTAGCRMVSLITLASDSSGVLGKEIVPLTKDQFMRGWPVAFKQQWKVLSRNPSWFPKVLMRKDLKFTWNIPKMCCAHANEQEPLDWTLVWRVSNVFQSMLPKSDFPWREPPFFFSVGDLWAPTLCFLHQWWLGRDGNDLAKYTSWLHISILWLYDTCLFIVCWNGPRKLQISSVLFQNQMFPTLRFLNFIDRRMGACFFFRLILGRTLALSLRPLASVVSFLGHEGTTFSLTFICRFKVQFHKRMDLTM